MPRTDAQRKTERDRYWSDVEASRAKNRQKDERSSRALLGRYGITKEDYDRMLKEQGGVCKLCHRPPQTKRRLHVDHDHRTRHVRGILCARCNWVIGLAKDDSELLNRMVEYLQ